MAFATAADIETRLGRELTDAEEAMAVQTIELVTAQIADAVGRDAAWATALTPVPGVLKALCIEKVIAVGTNPEGVESSSESLGQHRYAATFRGPGDGGGIFLTDAEQRLVRFTIFGRNTDSVMLGSHFQEVES